MNRVDQLTRQMEIVIDPGVVFGRQADLAHAFYRRLAQEMHPDSGGNDHAFQVLNNLYAAYGARTLPDSVVYFKDEITYTMYDNVTRKVVTEAVNRDLLINEVQQLQKIYATNPSQAFLERYPALDRHLVGDSVELTFNTPDFNRHVAELVTLSDMKQALQDEMRIKSLGWIWHRLLRALQYAHNIGIIHGGVLPNSIYLGPAHHDVILCNWYFSVDFGDSLRAISEEYLHIYPEPLQRNNVSLGEILLHSIPALDIYMAAKTILSIYVDIPDPLLDYFESLTVQPLRGVPTDIPTLIQNFDRIIYNELGWGRAFYPMYWINWAIERGDPA